ncbi:MAG: MFS transporter, partial [Chloroflexi bacterium]|nr:MFS transporter [Chloroflexota bacterium]
MSQLEVTAHPATPTSAHAEPTPFRLRVVLLMSLGHLTNDLYANSLTPIIPLLIQEFGLSMTMVGLLTTLRMLSGQVAQPLYGFLGDRLGRRWLLGLGPLLTVAVMGLSGWSPSYGVLALLVVVAGVGTAAFHPQGAALAGAASGRRHNLGMGLFLSGGSLGAALAPWLIVPIVSKLGLRATLLAAVPGLLVALYLLWSQGRLQWPRTLQRRTWKPNFNGNGRALGLLVAVASCRTVVESSVLAFLPVLLKDQGLTLMGSAAVLS